jgi:predicted nucleic acid-binding protein
MTTYYLDTSAAVKLYVSEVGSGWLQRLFVGPQPPAAVTSHLLRVEMWSAFARRLREKSVGLDDYSQMCDLFAEDRQNLYRFTPINEMAIRGACEYVEHYPLRASDAIHLAAALDTNRQLMNARRPGLVFLCADDRLLQAAAAEGLAVDNPNDHP